jgi:hypothetical protein
MIGAINVKIANNIPNMNKAFFDIVLIDSFRYALIKAVSSKKVMPHQINGVNNKMVKSGSK